MCFELDSLPPIPALSGAAVSHEDLVLESADGTRFAAFAAHPDEPSGAGVVVLPDVRGLYRFLRGARPAVRRARDRRGRDRLLRPDDRGGKRGDDFPYPEHVAQTTPEGIQADVRAAVEHLRGSAPAIFTVGFCFGGHHSWLAAAGGHGLRGAIGFYGVPGSRDGSPGPIERAAEMEAPILALQAGADRNITAAANAAFDEALTKAGVEHEIVTYDGAPHSFFDRRQEDFADASEDAWRRVLEFIRRVASATAASSPRPPG